MAAKAEQTQAAKKTERPAALTDVPEWASTSAIALLLGKTIRSVQIYTQNGLLPTEVPPGGGVRRYRTCETIQRYIAHIEQKAKDSASGGDKTELTLRKLEAEVALKESQGQLHRLKTAIAEGKYIPAEQATRELMDFMSTLKRFVLTIPTRVSGTLAGYTDTGTAHATEKALRKQLEAMLDAFVSGAITDIREGEQT